MAFPTTPTINQIYDRYLWDGEAWVQVGDVLESGSDYIKFTSGKLIQWGQISHTSDGDVSVIFTISYISPPLVTLGSIYDGGLHESVSIMSEYFTPTTSGFSARIIKLDGTRGWSRGQTQWQSIGDWK